jgi:hypothetical protein
LKVKIDYYQHQVFIIKNNIMSTARPFAFTCRWGQFRYYKNKSLSTAEISALFDADKAKYGL